jgi:hypothetical protein
MDPPAAEFQTIVYRKGGIAPGRKAVGRDESR